MENLEQVLRLKSPVLVGILNVTPDSFSDGGLYLRQADALAHASALIQAGAHMIDLGAESTAPGSKDIGPQEEFQRLKDIVPALSQQTLLSIDTFRASTARACLELGACCINDVSALRFDADLRAVVKDYRAAVVLMYSKEAPDHPHATDNPRNYEDVVQEICNFLDQRVNYALSGGIAQQKIILDPGMGRFISHDAKYSWQVLAQLERMKEAFPSFPILISTSRKGFLGGALNERDPLSALTALGAYLKGASLIRTHNVGLAKDFSDAWARMQPAAREGGFR